MVPLSAVAELTLGRGPNEIRRIGQQRVGRKAVELGDEAGPAPRRKRVALAVDGRNRDVVEQLEAPTRREPLARPLDEGDVRVRVAVDGEPDVGELAVRGVADRVEPRPVERDAQDLRSGAVEGESVEVGVGIRHSPMLPGTGKMHRWTARLIDPTAASPSDRWLAATGGG